MIRDAQEIQSLALKYSKPQLAHMAQIGLIDTQKAVLAAMMRDRISKEDAKPPTTTVAQDVLGMSPQIAPTSEPPQMGMAQAPAPEAPTQMAATGGLTSIPVKMNDYAGGGIVAFADGGDTGYEYKFNPDTGEYTLIGEKKKEIPVDTRQHLGAAGLGVFGSEGMDLMTGLPKGNMRDPVLGFAGGGIPRYAGDSQFGSLVGGSTMLPPQSAENANIFNQMAEGEQERKAAQDAQSAAYLQTLKEKQAQGLPLNRLEQMALDRAGASAPAPLGMPNYEVTKQAGSQSFGTPTQFIDATKKQPLPELGTKNLGGAPKAPAVSAPPLPAIGNVKPQPVAEYKMPEAETIQQALGRQEEADKAAGVDTGIFEKLRGEYEGKKGKVNERKQEAIGMAIMQTGLGLMGAAKGREMAALGESGQKALAGLVSTNEKIRDYEDKLEDKQRELYLAENEYKRTKSKSALDRVTSLENKRNELENKTVEAKNKRTEHEELIASQTRGQDITARGQDLQYKAHMAQIGAMFRPSEVERAQATYNELYQKDPAAAAKWLETRNTLMGAGRSGKTAADYMEQYADDWNKLDVLTKNDMKKQGIATEQQYINYRMQQHGKFTGGNTSPLIQSGAGGSALPKGWSVETH